MGYVMEIIVSIMIILVLIIIFLFKKLHVNSLQNDLYKHVAWCVSNDSKVFRCGMSLQDYLYNSQNKINLPLQYQIVEKNEWEFVNDILQQFRNELTENYFYGKLKIIHNKYVVPDKLYFMCALNEFLEKHECETTFMTNDMYKLVTRKNYGTWGGPLYDATYTLTDFAIIYHKLYLISYSYCKKSEILNLENECFNNDDYIRDIIDNKQIKISSM